MPYFKVSVSRKLSEEESRQLVDGLGSALNVCPEKRDTCLFSTWRMRKTYTSVAIKKTILFFPIYTIVEISHIPLKKS